MRAAWISGLGLMLSGWLAVAGAEEVHWHAASSPAASVAPAATAALVQPSANASTPSSWSVPRNPDGFPASPYVTAPLTAGSNNRLTSATAAPNVFPLQPVASSNGILQVQAVDGGPTPAPPPGSAIGPVAPPPPPPPPPAGADFAPSSSGEGVGGFFAHCKEKMNLDCGTWCDTNRHWFQSDHCFDQFISPVSSPFLDEDPRSLSEFRPIFIYQRIPASAPNVNGGNVEFLGFQARVAITERLSVVLSEFGEIWLNPHEQAVLHNGSGVSELRIGPKYTIIRDETSGTLVAAGLTFDIPIGASSVYQNTGNLSLAPYLSAAQTFGRSSFGSFDAMGTMGYNISVNDNRSQFFYLDLHLDYDILGLHKIYPLIELNYLHYGKAGNGPDFSFEGGDLFNFGSQAVSGSNNLTMALGARYKFCEWAQLGVAAEFPLCGSKDLNDFRLTVDFILRY